MIKLFLKLAVYGVFIFLLLECYVRVFHIYSDTPMRYIDEYGVEKRIPNQSGINVTGNRKQHVTPFQINSFGFNSLHDTINSNDKFKLALVGDSFIEGFHQPSTNSIGKMIETQVDTVEVYEFGCGGYDMADQIHLIDAYKDRFEDIDMIVLYLKYQNDLVRGDYKPNYGRIQELNGKIEKVRRTSKFLNYIGGLGIINKFSSFIQNRKDADNEVPGQGNNYTPEFDESSISNFKSLMDLYHFNRNKTIFLLDSRRTSPRFIEFCKNSDIQMIDIAKYFESTDKETTLIYDDHWNSFGRTLVAESVVEYINMN